MADGSIVFDTKIKTDDVKPQLEKLKAQVSALNAQLKTADSNRNKLYNAWEKSGFKDNGLRAKLAEADGEAKRLREDIERANEAIAMTKAAPDRKTTAGDAVDGISGVFSKFGKQISGKSSKESIFKKLKDGLSAAGNTVRGFLGTLKGGNKGLDTFNGRLKTGIGTVLKYAFGIRSLYVLFNRLRQFLSAGISNLQQYSQQTANSINALQTSATFAGNALAAAFEPILSAVVPILTTLIDALATACNWIARFFAMLGGQKTYTKAVKGANQYAKATSGVGSAAKKAADAEKGQLAAIDEINDITTNSSASGGGGGGGGGGADIGSMFETAQVAGDSLIDQMKAAMDAGDWQGAGKLLADKVNSMFEEVPWNDLGTRFGTNLSHAIAFGYGFIKNLNTDEWGKDIAEFVNGTISSMNVENAWSMLGGILVRGFTNQIDFLAGFILNLDYGEIAKAISGFFEGAFNEVTDWLNEFDFSAIGSKLWENLKDFVAGLDYSGLATSFFTMLGTAFRSLALLIGGFFGDIGKDIKDWWNTSIQGQDWTETASNLLNAIGDGFSNIGQFVQENIIDPFMNALIGEDKWSEFKTVATDIWNGFTKGLQEFFDNPVSWIKQHMIDPLVDGVKDLLGIHSPSTVFREIGTNIIDGLKEGLDNAWEAVSDFFTNGFNSVKDLIAESWAAVRENTNETWSAITDRLGTAKDTILSKWQNTKDWFNETVISPVKDKFSELGSRISEHMNTAKENVESGWEPVSDFFGSVRASINEKFQDVGSWFWSTFNSAKDNLINSFSRSSIAEHVRGIASDISGAMGGLASQAWSWGSDMVNGMKNGINYAKQAVVNAARSVANGIKSLLHFSRPDTGPLRDYESWMPDMMDGLANGIESNIPVVNRAMSKLADSMSAEMKVMPEIPDLAAGKVLPAAFGINFRADSQKEVLGSMKDLADAFNSFGGNDDVVSAINTLIAVVREKKLLASDVGAAAVDYMNAEYDRTGEPVLKGV